MTGPGFIGGNGWIGYQLDVGADYSAAVIGEHHRAIHLGKFPQSGGRETDIKCETAVADGLDAFVVTQHDQSPGSASQNALQAIT